MALTFSSRKRSAGRVGPSGRIEAKRAAFQRLSSRLGQRLGLDTLRYSTGGASPEVLTPAQKVSAIGVLSPYLAMMT